MRLGKYKIFLLIFVFIINVSCSQSGPIIEKSIKYYQSKNFGLIRYDTIIFHFKKPITIYSVEVNEKIGNTSEYKLLSGEMYTDKKNQMNLEIRYYLRKDDLYAMNNTISYIIETNKGVYHGEYKYVDKTDPESTKQMRLDDPNVILVPIPKK
ncbi:MAG TPA: hypothetical protein PLE16_12525 [Spirochaetota bacterium]|jgi:hypothetical protein|nr:hypothetical protein [Spirochaetota bacterium]